MCTVCHTVCELMSKYMQMSVICQQANRDKDSCCQVNLENDAYTFCKALRNQSHRKYVNDDVDYYLLLILLLFIKYNIFFILINSKLLNVYFPWKMYNIYKKNIIILIFDIAIPCMPGESRLSLQPLRTLSSKFYLAGQEFHEELCNFQCKISLAQEIVN